MHHPKSSRSSQPPRRRMLPRKPPGYNNRIHAFPDADIEPVPDSQGRSFPPVLPTDLPVEIVLARLPGVSGYGPTWSACCPAHTDLRPSLSITETPEHVLLVHCHAGCSPEAVLAAIDLDLCFLYPSPFALQAGKRKQQSKVGLPRPRGHRSVAEPVIDYDRFEDVLRSCRAPPRRLKELARMLRLPLPSIRALEVGYHEGRDCWAFPERDGQSRVVGIVYRSRQGGRACEPGSKRGLTLPRDHRRLGEGPVYLPEGASDVAALHSVGALAFGRPAARASSLARQWLAQLLREHGGRDIVVLGERDRKENGRWPGRDGAQDLALYLRLTLDRSVAWDLPTPPFKDVREQIVAGAWPKGLSTKEST